MKSPYIRIREKNLEIKSLKETITAIATILGSQPVEVDIVQAIIDLQSLRPSLTAAVEENEDIRRNMGGVIQQEVEKHTFNLQLENTKLKDKVESLEKMLDNKNERLAKPVNAKGFWDFIYKLFKLN